MEGEGQYRRVAHLPSIHLTQLAGEVDDEGTKRGGRGGIRGVQKTKGKRKGTLEDTEESINMVEKRKICRENIMTGLR